ncbi:endonuclease [Bacteroidia bacterium]|nr:endonuclease [Bacteroidia bacterium]
MKAFGNFFVRIFTVLAGVGLVFLLISSFSDMISPEKNRYIPYFGLFFPFIFGFNVLMFLFWIVCRKWKQVILTGIIFLICASAIHTYFPLNRKTKEIPEDCIKMLTYNVMRFHHLQKHTKAHPNPILQYIVEQHADIICMQEYAASPGGKDHLTEQDIREALKATPYYHIEKLKISTPGQTFGLAIFSKYPILSTRALPIDSEYNGAFVAELNIKGKKVMLINNHLESNKITEDERSEYYDFTKDPDTQKLENFTHMMFQRLTPAFRLRAKQADMIAQIIKKNTMPYILVCGDFNDTPISYARRTIKGNLVDSFVESGLGMGTTFNRHRFLFRIDNIFHSKNIKAYNCTKGNLRDSDHYPVSTYLQFRD